MYCPKCGTENAEANKYCRACRENLGIISQAMKQRLPVVIASKLDHIFDSRSERFRRDSALCFLIGISYLVAGLSLGKITHALIMSCPFLLFGVRSYLAYRRSLEPDFDWGEASDETTHSEPFDKGWLATLDIGDSHAENVARTTKNRLMFCPKCGRGNEGDYKFCRGCGENLKLLSEAMEPRWRKTLNRELDGYIRRKNRKLPENARSFRRFWWLWFALVGSYSAIRLLGGKEGWWMMPLLMLPLLLTGFWDYVTYQRLESSIPGDNKSPAKPASPPDSVAELPSAPTTNELAPPLSVTESTTRRLEALSVAEKRSGELV